MRATLPEDLPDVPMDVMQIDQVLTNLLENAVRHTPPDKRIEIAVQQCDDTVLVRISDGGRGIPADRRVQIFEPLKRGERSTGTGLGLSIARAIVDAHGGRIWIEGGRSVGTTIVFELPQDGA